MWDFQPVRYDQILVMSLALYQLSYRAPLSVDILVLIWTRDIMKAGLMQFSR